MKLSWILVFCGSVAAINAQTFLPAVRVSQRSSRTIRTFFDMCNLPVNLGKKVCNSDTVDNCEATGFYVCSLTPPLPPPEPQPIGSTVLCGEAFPFCKEDNGEAVCVADRPRTCPLRRGVFYCTNTGIFPDPANCDRYWNCYNSLVIPGLIESELLLCPPGTIFDPSSTTDYCRVASQSLCTPITCNNDIKNVVMSFPFYSNLLGTYIASCQGTNRTAIVTFCPKNFQVDTTTLPPTCRFYCIFPSDRGPVRGSPSSYYSCYWSPLGLAPRITPCLAPLVYNDTQKICVRA